MPDDAPVSAGPAPRLIVGLGNPGGEYRDTRHNVGFMVVDELAKRLGAPFAEQKAWRGDVAKFPGGWLLKPQTYMNESGRSVLAVAKFFKLTAGEVLVIFDDLDLPLGRLRLRLAGSAGGHNGMRSIIGALGTDQFPRMKLGIAPTGGRPAGHRMVGHVLGKFAPEEAPVLAIIIERAADAATTALRSGMDAAMNLFNRKEDA